MIYLVNNMENRAVNPQGVATNAADLAYLLDRVLDDIEADDVPTSDPYISDNKITSEEAADQLIDFLDSGDAAKLEVHDEGVGRKDRSFAANIKVEAYESGEYN